MYSSVREKCKKKFVSYGPIVLEDYLTANIKFEFLPSRNPLKMSVHMEQYRFHNFLKFSTTYEW